MSVMRPAACTPIGMLHCELTHSYGSMHQLWKLRVEAYTVS